MTTGGLSTFRAKNHPQQIAKRGAIDSIDDRETDPAFFMETEARLGPFTIDAAASAVNAKCERFWSIDDDGLAQPWAGERVWCNPPYSDIRPWLEKAHAEPDAYVVMLLPANRTEQAWWQDLIEPHRDNGGRLRTEFIRGRLRFIAGDKAVRMIGPNERPPFGCVLCVFARVSGSGSTPDR